MSFGARLREKREEKKLTQGQLGEGLGTDGKDAGKAVVYGWEKDQHHPKADQLAMICQRLSCSADYLLFGRVDAARLTPEAVEIASALDRMSPRQREWTISNIRKILEVSNETFALLKREGEPDEDQGPVLGRAGSL